MQVNSVNKNEMLVKNHSPKTTLHATVYQQTINLGDGVYFADTSPMVMMPVPRDQQGTWGKERG